MIEEYDKIIVMAEKETLPEFLLNNNKIVFWDFGDPKDKPDQEYKELTKNLKKRIKEFIRENNL